MPAVYQANQANQASTSTTQQTITAYESLREREEALRLSSLRPAPVIPIGTIVLIEHPETSRTDACTIPAIVMKQWEDGNLMLFCLHPENRFQAGAYPWQEVKLFEGGAAAQGKVIDDLQIRVFALEELVNTLLSVKPHAKDHKPAA